MNRLERLSVGVFGLTLAAWAVLFFRRLRLEPLVAYGTQGAEYLEHLQRQLARELLQSQAFLERLGSLRSHLVLLDGEYPALLALVGAWLEPCDDPIRAAVLLNLGWVVILLMGTAALTQRLALHGHRLAPDTSAAASTASTGSPSSVGAWWAACSVLLLPAISSSAHRYYYDLPLTSLCVWTAWALAGTLTLQGTGAIVAALGAGLLSGLSCLMKWQAALVLTPIWIWAGVARGELPRAKRVPSLVLGLGLFVVTCWPVLRRSGLVHAGLAAVLPGGVLEVLLPPSSAGGSVDTALLQGARGWLSPPEVGARALFYARGVWESSAGPLLTLALMLTGGQVLKGRVFSRIRGCLFWLLPTLLLLCGRVQVRDERFLLPLLPLVLAWLWHGWTPRNAWGKMAPLAVFLVGWLQLLDVERILELPAVMQVRSSVERRGWNRLGEGRLEPFQERLEHARALCEAQGPARVWIDPALGRIGEAPGRDFPLHAWRWAFERGCRAIPVEVGLPEGALAATNQGSSDGSESGSISEQPEWEGEGPLKSGALILRPARTPDGFRVERWSPDGGPPSDGSAPNATGR